MRQPVGLLLLVALALAGCGASESTAQPSDVATTTTAPPTTAAPAPTEPAPSATTLEFDYQADIVLAELPAAFDAYGELITSGQEGEAYDRYAGPELRSRISRDDFVEANSTSSLHDFIVYHAFWTNDAMTTAEAWVTFISFQSAPFGPDGQTCSIWDLTYQLERAPEGWKIQAAKNEPGSPQAC